MAGLNLRSRSRIHATPLLPSQGGKGCTWGVTEHLRKRSAFLTYVRVTFVTRSSNSAESLLKLYARGTRTLKVTQEMLAFWLVSRGDCNDTLAMLFLKIIIARCLNIYLKLQATINVSSRSVKTLCDGAKRYRPSLRTPYLKLW